MNLPHKPTDSAALPKNNKYGVWKISSSTFVVVKVALTLSKSVSAERGRFSANNSACPSQDGPPALSNKAVTHFFGSFCTMSLKAHISSVKVVLAHHPGGAHTGGKEKKK